MMIKKVQIIFNPASAGGKTGQRKDEIIKSIEKFFGKEYYIHFTARQFDAEMVANQIQQEGCETIISVGGDGTIQEIVNGLVEEDRVKSNCALGIISCGTGQGFAQSIGLPSGLNEQLEIIKNHQVVQVDIGKITYNSGNNELSRYFINEFQLGIGGAVVRNLQGKQKRFGGFLYFGLGALSAIFNHPNQKITIAIDNDIKISKKFVGIVIGNGAFTGGGMNLTAKAKVNDSLLDVLLIHEQTTLQRLRTFPKIYSGKHLNSKHFSYYQAREISISSNELVPIEADGERFGNLPCKVKVLPNELKVFANF